MPRTFRLLAAGVAQEGTPAQHLCCPGPCARAGVSRAGAGRWGGPGQPWLGPGSCGVSGSTCGQPWQLSRREATCRAQAGPTL